MEAHALHFEAIKYAYRQSRDGVVVSFVVHPNDVPSELAVSHIGARYMVALVEIGDDEKPVRKEDAQPQPTAARTEKAGAKRPWRDLPPQTQAAMRCDEPAFQIFLREERQDDWHESQDADACVKLICGVESKKDLSTNQKARVIWKQLDDAYQAWKALEHA